MRICTCCSKLHDHRIWYDSPQCKKMTCTNPRKNYLTRDGEKLYNSGAEGSENTQASRCSSGVEHAFRKRAARSSNLLTGFFHSSEGITSSQLSVLCVSAHWRLAVSMSVIPFFLILSLIFHLSFFIFKCHIPSIQYPQIEATLCRYPLWCLSNKDLYRRYSFNDLVAIFVLVTFL